MSSPSSSVSAAHRLSSYAVFQIAERTDAASAERIQEEVEALRSHMDGRGVCASTFIRQEAAAGGHPSIEKNRWTTVDNLK